MAPVPDHHPPDEMLAAYAAGGADDGEALLVATHLSLCPACREVCDAYDALGGAILDRSPSVDPPGIEALLARLDEPPPAPLPPPPPASGPNDLPLPLRRYTGSLANVPFRTVAPGIRRFDLPMSQKERPVALLALSPGLRVPPHRHAAAERGLVLAGGFTDEASHFTRGDVCVRGPDDADEHRQLIDPGDPCVVLMVDDGPKIPTTLVGKAVNWLFGF